MRKKAPIQPLNTAEVLKQLRQLEAFATLLAQDAEKLRMRCAEQIATLEGSPLAPKKKASTITEEHIAEVLARRNRRMMGK